MKTIWKNILSFLALTAGALAIFSTRGTRKKEEFLEEKEEIKKNTKEKIKKANDEIKKSNANSIDDEIDKLL